MPTCALHMAYLLKRHRCDLVCVQLLQSRPHSHMSVPTMWEHIVHDQLQLVREVLVPPLREPTILLVLILVQEQVPFPNHGHWFFPWSNLGNPSPTDLVTLTQLTAISCIINSVFPFNRIQAWRAEILPTLSPLPVESSMRLFFRKPVIMFRTSPISSWRTLATRTSLSCSTRTPLSLTLWCLPSRKTSQPKVRGVWSYSSFVASCDALLSLVHRLLHFSSGNSSLWGLGALEPNREWAGFLIMPKRPKRNKEEWNADTTNTSVCGATYLIAMLLITVR